MSLRKYWAIPGSEGLAWWPRHQALEELCLPSATFLSCARAYAHGEAAAGRDQASALTA
jgi:hypothetical protein